MLRKKIYKPAGSSPPNNRFKWLVRDADASLNKCWILFLRSFGCVAYYYYYHACHDIILFYISIQFFPPERTLSKINVPLLEGHNNSAMCIHAPILDEHSRIFFLFFLSVWPCGVPAQATEGPGPMRVRSMPYMRGRPDHILSGMRAAVAFSPHHAKATTSVFLRLHLQSYPHTPTQLQCTCRRPIHHPPFHSTLCSLSLYAPFHSACYFSSRLWILAKSQRLQEHMYVYAWPQL
jgi:hypothetical protein